MLLHHVVPHPGALVSPDGGEVALIVVPVLLGPGMQGPGGLPMVYLVFNLVQ